MERERRRGAMKKAGEFEIGKVYIDIDVSGKQP